jgi:hypothetical protein
MDTKIILIFLTCLTLNGQVLIDQHREAGAGVGDDGLLVNLAAYYRFEEAGQTDAAQDSTGNNRDLTANGNLPSTSGAILNARQQSTSSDNYFSRADEDWQHFGSTNFTVAFWYRAATPGGISEDQTLVAKGDSDLSWMVILDYGTGWSNNYALQFYYSTDGGIPINLLTIETSGALDDSEYFIYIRRNGTTFDMGYASMTELSITAIVSATASVTLWDSTSPLTVGAWLNGGIPNPDRDAEGWIDELGIWNDDLSNCQLGKLHRKTTYATFDLDSCL